jgi:predicted Zn-dependent protease
MKSKSSTFRLEILGRALALLCAVTLAGCAELERQGQMFSPPAPPPPTPPTKPAPPKPENRGSVQHKELLAQFGGEYQAPAAERYLDAILVKLAQASEMPGQTAYKVTILNTPVVNAFALPSGNLYVTRGLLALAGDASEVAAVMAHEIAHVTLRHSALRAEKEREAALISQAASVIQSRQKGEEERSRQRLSVASFSRQQELDADETGVKVIARAGFDPYGGARFLTALGRSSELRAALYGKRKDSMGFDIMSTHPSTPERVARVIAVARQIGAPGIGNRDRAGYLAAINGVAFGDDPMEGYVRDRKFTHPRMRFTLTAPEGFLLENSSEAVFGVRQSDNVALRLDTVKNVNSESLEAYVGSGWVDGLLPSSVRRIDVNGLPAVIAVARAGEWNFRLAVIQSGETLYRMIFAARSLTDAVEREFMASIMTFRRISAEEAREAHALKISVVSAGLTDSVQSLSGQMTTPNRPLEYFRLLNGLDENEPVVSGERYKIVTE